MMDIGRKFGRCSYHGLYLSQEYVGCRVQRSASIAVIACSKDVCDGGSVE